MPGSIPDSVVLGDNGQSPQNDTYGSVTAAGGTAFTLAIPPRADAYTFILGLLYENGATAHTLTILRVQETCSIVADAAAGATTWIVNDMPHDAANGVVASGDYWLVEHGDGTLGTYVTSSISGNTVTSGALSKMIAIGAKAWYMGAAGDANGTQFTISASKDRALPASGGGDFRNLLARSTEKNEPLLIYSNNATNAGILVSTTRAYE